jgi:nucleoside 2-deoxyribosyltransferase
MLTIIGGTYREICDDPSWDELYGSGLRAAIALSTHIPAIQFTTCIGTEDSADLQAVCDVFTIQLTAIPIAETVTFRYQHPLARPAWREPAKLTLPLVEAANILLYDLLEANVAVKGQRVVYDPQSGVPVSFRSTGSTAEHLALVLNKREALSLSGLPATADLTHVGQQLLASEEADVVVIKNGAHGALVIEASGVQTVPVFETRSVWPIGSGDIFSAVFAWKWLHEQRPAAEAALAASRLTAQYCQFKYLPLPATPDEDFKPLLPRPERRKIYLAGPFFTLAQRWLIAEALDKLAEFGNEVFSPFHEVGLGSAEQVVAKDIAAIEWADVLVAMLDGLDPGTLFEIGYAKALGKHVVAYIEDPGQHDLTMLIGTNCEITNDFTTAIYKASW